MEIHIDPKFIYYPATGDFGGSQAPEPASVEITGIKVLDEDGEELKTPPVEMYRYFLDNCEKQLIKRAFEIVEENKNI